MGLHPPLSPQWHRGHLLALNTQGLVLTKLFPFSSHPSPPLNKTILARDGQPRPPESPSFKRVRPWCYVNFLLAPLSP